MPMTEMEQEALEHLRQRLEAVKKARANKKKSSWSRRDQWAIGLLVALAGRNNGLREGETPADFIERRIYEAFRDLAGEIGNLCLDMMNEDEIAGVPFELSRRAEELVNVWWGLVNEEDDQ